MTNTKFVFVTGGVLSSVGKGIAAASMGMLFKARGYKVTAIKMDPYLNVDAGTMSPYQHGEVFVTEDGAETDLDLGHYERFLDENLSGKNNITSGKIYSQVITKERCNGMEEELRQAGFGVTAVDCSGMEGPHRILYVMLKRRDLPSFLKTIRQLDKDAFISISDTRKIVGGYFSQVKAK